jgi:hypothetical protein
MPGARIAPRARHAWTVFAAALTTMMTGGLHNAAPNARALWADQRGEMDPSRLINSIIAVVIVAAIVAATIGLFFTSIADVNNELDTADLNDTTANTIAGIYPIVLGIAAVLGIVGLVMAAMKFRK